MSVSSRKELKKIWSLVEPKLGLPDAVKITNTDYCFGFNKHTYIALELNQRWAFFVFDIEDDSVVLFSHDVLPVAVLEVAVIVKQAIDRHVYPTKVKAAKAAKSE